MSAFFSLYASIQIKAPSHTINLFRDFNLNRRKNIGLPPKKQLAFTHLPFTHLPFNVYCLPFLKIEAAPRACSRSEELMQASLFSRSIAALKVEN